LTAAQLSNLINQFEAEEAQTRNLIALFDARIGASPESTSGRMH
jgi:hypothetical protein